jgi:chromosome partitioning protein
MIVYSFVNQKGGVGKTTTVVNSAAYLARAGKRVLIVDLDPQANATACVGIDKNTVSGGTYEALLGAAPSGYLLHSKKLGLSVLPSSQELAGAEVELVSAERRERRLATALTSLAGRYDYVLIDCPPSLGLLTLNGLLAAQGGIVIPVQCEYLALEGLGHLNQTINRVRQGLYEDLRIRGVVLTMFDGRTNLSNDVVAEVRRFFPELTFKTVIPRTIRLAEAPSYGQPISNFAPGTPGAQAYEALAREILQGDEQQINPGEAEHG